MPPPDALPHPTKRNQETRHFKVQVVHRLEKNSRCYCKRRLEMERSHYSESNNFILQKVKHTDVKRRCCCLCCINTSLCISDFYSSSLARSRRSTYIVRALKIIHGHPELSLRHALLVKAKEQG